MIYKSTLLVLVRFRIECHRIKGIW